VPIKRTYGEFGDACFAANALDLVGDRWTLIVVRELILGPKRFADLEEAARGITPAVLAERLRALRAAGIVQQVVLPDLARTRVYAATEWGRGLEEVLAALARWYSAGPDPTTAGGMTPDAVVLAMRKVAPEVPGELAPLTLRLYDERRPDPPVRDFRVGVVDGRLDVGPGIAVAPLATATAESTIWSQLLFGGLRLAAAERGGGVRIDGDRSTVARLVGLFAVSAAPGRAR
jgi:DNA-binding HxlR family transcriptional regulator